MLNSSKLMHKTEEKACILYEESRWISKNSLNNSFKNEFIQS